jgi:hypothetical protein
MKKNKSMLLVMFIVFLGTFSFFFGRQFARLRFDPVPPPETDTNKAVFVTTKTDRPELKFFVMSFCQYGNQMEKTLRPVYDLLQSKVDFTPHYIFQKITDLPTFCKNTEGTVDGCEESVKAKAFSSLNECKKIITNNLNNCLNQGQYLKSTDGTMYSSLHGRQELNQDVREMCAWNQLGSDKKTWWNFVNLVGENCNGVDADTCWEQQGKQVGLDTNKITECFNKEAFDLINKEIANTDSAKISSSPTVLINNTIYGQTLSQTPDSIKLAICAAMKKPSKECNTVLPPLPGPVPIVGTCDN